MKRGSSNFTRLWSYSAGFYGVWIAFIGKKMGLLEMLEKKPFTSKLLATQSGLYQPAVEAWCSAASAYGLVAKKPGGKFWLPPEMSSFLNDKAHPNYLGGQFAYLAMRSLEYSGFEKLFKSGKIRPMSNSLEAIEEATHWDHYTVLEAIKKDKRLRPLLTQGCKFADIGCGTGSLLEKLAAEYPRSEFHGIDPSAKAVARARKSLKGTLTKIEKRRAEDFRLSENFDILYLGESLYAADEKQRVVINCHRALKPGGTIIVLEGLVPEGKLRREDMVIMGMQLDFALQGYKFMTKDELRGLLESAHFRNIVFTPLGGSAYLARARK